MLCDRLYGFDDRVSLEWLTAAMAARLAGPRARPPAEWLPRLLGDAWERTFADPQDVQHAMHTVLGRWNVIASQLDAEALFDAPDELRLSPLLTEFPAETREALLAEGKLTPEEAADWPLLASCGPWASWTPSSASSRTGRSGAGRRGRRLVRGFLRPSRR